MKRSSSTCRLRKVSCPECGYTARIARSWMTVGLPSCPCGGILEPDTPADRAYCGLIGQDDVPQAAWNAICRDNGWPIVRNQGQHAQTRPTGASTLHAPAKPQCAYPGCGKWTAASAEYCAAHDVSRLETCPF